MFRHRHEFPVEGEMPGFDGATAWLNGAPLSAAELRGRVVLVSFGTYTCINWIRSLPYVRAWADTYADHGLTVIGVQTPEFQFEGHLDNVNRAIKEMDVRYPVIVDNDFAVWQAFDNHYWPALYFVDALGRIRHHHFGEGDYEQSEKVLQMLVQETGAHIDQGLVDIEPKGVEAPADWANVRSPESYVGYARADNFASPGGIVPNESLAYATPAGLRRNQWALSGHWSVGSEAVQLNEPGGSMAFQFHARDLHLVMGPTTARPPARFTVRLNGERPGRAHGIDTDEGGHGTADYQRMYQLIRQPAAISDQLFEIDFLDAGVEAFVFTFG